MVYCIKYAAIFAQCICVCTSILMVLCVPWLLRVYSTRTVTTYSYCYVLYLSYVCRSTTSSQYPCTLTFCIQSLPHHQWGHMVRLTCLHYSTYNRILSSRILPPVMLPPWFLCLILHLLFLSSQLCLHLPKPKLF